MGMSGGGLWLLVCRVLIGLARGVLARLVAHAIPSPAWLAASPSLSSSFCRSLVMAIGDESNLSSLLANVSSRDEAIANPRCFVCCWLRQLCSGLPVIGVRIDSDGTLANRSLSFRSVT
ncbi:hypothetical protein MNNICLKF_00516 [Synechococcus sp. CBW1107]|nr:hypothetical protein MNNICLKF_00516 [Synechococcus sp. CBW1107]